MRPLRGCFAVGLLLGGTLLILFGCATPPASPAVRARVDQDTARISREIAATCLGSGLFKLADGAVASAVPAAALPIAAVNSGVDTVCARPDLFAADVSTVEWLARNFRDAVNRRRPPN